MSEECGRAAVFGLWPYSALVPVSAIPYVDDPVPEDPRRTRAERRSSPIGRAARSAVAHPGCAEANSLARCISRLSKKKRADRCVHSLVEGTLPDAILSAICPSGWTRQHPSAMTEEQLVTTIENRMRAPGNRNPPTAASPASSATTERPPKGQCDRNERGRPTNGSSIRPKMNREPISSSTSL
jgi:hypothetical protein